MAQMSYEQFVEMNQNKDPSTNQAVNINYFFLAEDGETVIARFNIPDINKLEVHSRHSIVVDGKRRNVECLRGFKEPVDTCPLCASGSRPSFRIYVPLLVYTVENGKIVATPQMWDQPVRLRETLKSYFMDYGDLRKVLFKITRHGKKGDTNTNYTITLANPQVYRDADYPADFSAFESFDLHKNMLLSKNKQELEEYLSTGEFGSQRPQTQAVDVGVVQDPPKFVARTQPFTRARRESEPLRNVSPQDTTTPSEEPSSSSPGPRRYTYTY